MHVDQIDQGRATAPVAWQELGALAVNAAAAHGSCFFLSRTHPPQTIAAEPFLVRTFPPTVPLCDARVVQGRGGQNSRG